MKKTLGLCLALLLGTMAARADEGMWLLKLMERQHLEDSLRKAGLQMPASELYSETSPSLRECVGIFGAGCTGEIVSPDGLVLTNNHCGFSYLHAISTMDRNYLQGGYFATGRDGELPVPDLTFTFVVRIDDVTALVEAEAKKQGADEYTAQSQRFLEPLAASLLKQSGLEGKKGMEARIVPYFGGNEFYAFFEQTYTDVRLVANPPQNIAQFGFNQDNWMWPRHNADFTMFRIYADAKGEPADYSEKNVPLKCRKFLPISLKGPQPDSYTMVMGFPGRTSRYLTASEVELRTGSQNAPVNLAGEAQLTYMKQLMDADSVLNLKLADDYMSLGNVVKNYGGMNESVKKTGLIAIKRAEEKAFREFAARSGKPEYRDIIDRIDSLCAAVRDTLHDYTLFGRTIGAQDFYVRPSAIEAYLAALESGKQKEVEAAREVLLKFYDMAAGSVDLELDRHTVDLLLPYWQKYARLECSRELFCDPAATRVYFDEMYAKSLFRSREALEAFLQKPDAAALKADPLYRHWKSYQEWNSQWRPSLQRYEEKRRELDKIYTCGLCEMYDWAKAPDANFTLRMTYGHTGGYQPRDAVSYGWQTVLGGMFEKENPADPDYVVNEKLRGFYEAGDFGRYAREDGQLPTCFLSDNDITGGNSGSPVMNAKGELIGLAFDGNIESLSSDLRFNPQLQRCINVDIRYVLFLLDKFGGCKYVLDEMDIRE